MDLHLAPGKRTRCEHYSHDGRQGYSILQNLQQMVRPMKTTVAVSRRLFLRALLASGVGIAVSPLIPKVAPVPGPPLTALFPDGMFIGQDFGHDGFTRWTIRAYGFSGKTGAIYMLNELVSINEAAKTYPFKKLNTRGTDFRVTVNPNPDPDVE